ncbi:hypothetical protein [Paenibacillus gorillae]|uniref:hypothetical protein n=1 Tax=Paenibacillus gorillae TaxID=1243662 RepID=UPI0004BB5ACE|nr:hypothetical protein [Paenibacillus gorillae]
MEERGIQTDRGDLNRAAKEHNAIVVELEAYRRKAVRQEIEPQKADSGLLKSESTLVATKQDKNTPESEVKQV